MSRYQLTNLRCEYLVNPLAIETKAPRLSWEGVCAREGATQTAYRILVADSPEALRANEGNLWDSGEVRSSQSLHVQYAGKALSSRSRAYWKVMVWDERGKPSTWSKPASWSMGILERKLWEGRWIGAHLGNTLTSPRLRKEFRLKKVPVKAYLYATATGLYHMTLNGKPVGDDVFAPGWTDFKKRIYYRCYDLTSQLKTGTHCLGAELGDGWYRGTLAWAGNRNSYGSHVLLLANLYLEYADGSSEVIATDLSWKVRFGPTVSAGFYEGETVDAQLDEPGWDRAGFNDAHWDTACERFDVDTKVALESYPAEPVRRTQELKPVKMWAVSPGKYIFDFGQNFAGRVRISMPGKAGAVVRMRFGEMVNPDKSLYVENLRSAISTDTYVMRGTKKEVWEPKFTFHGFRYVEITGCPQKPTLAQITGVVIGSDTTPVGSFSCSSQMLNQLYSNAVWTQRANFLEVPTDCPQRDERLGWTGDAQIFIRTAICNMDVAAFFTKWMVDLADTQYPDGAFANVAPNIHCGKGDAAWGDAGVVCPWTLYQCYEDRVLLEKMYPYMKKWVGYLKKTSRKFLRGPEMTHTFGDWLSIKADTPPAVLQTAHFAYAADIVRKSADVLGKAADARTYGRLFNDIKAAFNKAYVKKDGRIHGDTQTAYLMALKFNLLSDTNAKRAAKYLVADIRKKNNHSSTGFVGTGLIMSVLRDTGNLDTAYTLLENTTFPSWGYSVVNGATTIWERWDGWIKDKGPGDVNMNSYSHYAYGAVVEWMFDTVAGIDHAGAGFQQIRLQPRPGGSLKHASASYVSPYGRVRSAWRRQGKKVSYEVEIPANTQATVSLPVADLAGVKVNGQTLAARDASVCAKDQTFVLPAGQYTILFVMD